MSKHKHELQAVVNDLKRQKSFYSEPFERRAMHLEDQLAQLVRERSRIEEVQEFLETQRENFREDISSKENQL